ncbi:MAG: DUF2157 domain-containing protein [Acidobacteriota bacterium]|nr:DUF2157 domain-containing protein [Acidobacteriota bacterium]
MLSFEPELQSLRDAGVLPAATADALLARERREVFSLHPELRICAWGGTMLLATAAGIFLKNNLARLGPIALAAIIAAVAIACYAFAWIRRGRASLADDSVLLLGALLLSGDVAFLESQFHFFGVYWYRQFLVVALLHGAGAYAYRSRALLTLAITAAASWLGVRTDANRARDYALAAFGASAVVLMWRAIDQRLRERTEFSGTFEHFAAIFAALGCAALWFETPHGLGALLGIAVSIAIVMWGFRRIRESFVLYGFVFGVVSVNVLLFDVFREGVLAFFVACLSAFAAIVALIRIHERFKELRA